MSSPLLRLLPSTTFGTLVRCLSRGRLFQFPEEEPGYVLPEGYALITASRESTVTQGTGQQVSSKDDELVVDKESTECRTQSPETTDKAILVSWYSNNDPENPRCWPLWVKLMVYFQINFYTFIVYMASSIFSAAQPEFETIYGVSKAEGSLGLALVLLGYGLGALLFSPLSEIPAIGRNPPYTISLALFVLVSGLAVAVDNAPGFLVLRFLQGLFGSPCLATGAASLTDITEIINIPYGLWIWGTCSVAAPAVGPCIAAFSITAYDWRWSMWVILWGAAPCLVLLLFLPETFGPAILHARAARLRAVTGNDSFKAASEMDRSRYSLRSIVNGALIIPWKINALDPAILFTTLYTALVYAIFYSFFEVFPFVYQEIYHMDITHMGLVFLAAVIAALLVMPLYFLFIHYAIAQPIRNGNGTFPPPECRLIPALFISPFVPAGMYLFAWTSRAEIHWTVPTVGFILIMAGVITLLQCMFGYMAVAYPHYAASLFAMNDFARSTLAFGAILWSRPLYRDLGVSGGTSLVGALTVPCVFGIFALYLFGERLRKRSRFAG
ncbi:major facilitator superfamily domain-containing protein [Aspergillus egyptiacus]|nr:major facilitator superfamily domain-containing protein [Aspergillus egyptiacus]